MAFIISSYNSVRAALCSVLVILCVHLVPVSRANGNARLIEPAMRSSLWRFNPKATLNHNDQSLDCGGPQIQFNLNRGRCGVCGDPYHEPRENERGGKYDSGIIARRYRTGTKVTMIADLVAGNGGGYFEVKLCPRNNPTARVTQACFDKYPLQIKNGKKRRLTIPENTRYPSGLYRLDVKLPKGVTCTNCVIQWHYHASNEWGYDSNGRGCMGCGPQTEIYNCADVTIGYYGDPEGKLGPTSDVSVGALAQNYDIYSNGQYGTGVSPMIVNSGMNPGWASTNDLTGAAASSNENENENLIDGDQGMMAASLNRQAAGFANLFLGDGGINDNNNAFMTVPDYYNYYDDYGLDNMNMMSLMGMGGGGSGESGESSPNFARASFNLRTYGGGSSGSSEEGGMNFRRNFEMNIPSLSRQYNAYNGGGSDSSEEQGGRRTVNRVNNNVRNRQNDMQRLRDALRDIANRQKLRNGLHDIVENLENRNNGNDYYNGGGGSSSSEENYPRNRPNYFRDRIRGGGSSSSDCSSESSEEGGCGGGRVVEYYDYPTPPEVVPPTEPPKVVESTEVVPPKVIPTTTTTTEAPTTTTEAPTTTTEAHVTTTEAPVTTTETPDDYGDYPDTGPNRGDSVYNNEPGMGPTQEDLDFIANRQAELDRWREIEEAERLRKMQERSESWLPPVLPSWPYNTYQTGLFSQPNINPYSMFNADLNMNFNLNPGMTPQIPTLSREYPPWQLPNMLTNMETPASRLSQPFPQTGYRTDFTSSTTQSQTPASPNQIFSWMPSANEVMTMGSSKSPIFSQKVANQYLSPFLALTQSHPSLRCQQPDQLVCVATPAYRNIPNADAICTSECRSGGACGADYCSCACQKTLVCVHQASRNAPGQMGVPELDMWCTDQCNAGQCPNQLCACDVLN